MSNSLDLDQDKLCVSADLGPTCLQRLSSDDKSPHALKDRLKQMTKSYFCFDRCFKPQPIIFSHFGMISCLPGLNQYYTADKVCCSRRQHSDFAGGESQTSNPSIHSQTLYQLSHRSLLFIYLSKQNNSHQINLL